MLSIYKTVIKEQEITLQEGTDKKIAAALSGLVLDIEGRAIGATVGGVQRANINIYQSLKSKLTGVNKVEDVNVMNGILLGAIPLVGSFYNFSNQKKIDMLREEILKHINPETKEKLKTLGPKLKSGKITDKELKELVKIEKNLYKKLDEKEIKKLQNIIEKGA